MVKIHTNNDWFSEQKWNSLRYFEQLTGFLTRKMKCCSKYTSGSEIQGDVYWMWFSTMSEHLNISQDLFCPTGRTCSSSCVSSCPSSLSTIHLSCCTQASPQSCVLQGEPGQSPKPGLLSNTKAHSSRNSSYNTCLQRHRLYLPLWTSYFFHYHPPLILLPTSVSGCVNRIQHTTPASTAHSSLPLILTQNLKAGFQLVNKITQLRLKLELYTRSPSFLIQC